jgi:hypothetical protein
MSGLGESVHSRGKFGLRICGGIILKGAKRLVLYRISYIVPVALRSGIVLYQA